MGSAQKDGQNNMKQTQTETTKIKLTKKLIHTQPAQRPDCLFQPFSLPPSLAAQRPALPVLRPSSSAVQHITYVPSNLFFFLFSPSLSSLPPPTPDGVDAAAFLPLFAVLEGTFTSGLHCVDTRPSAAKNVSPPGRAGPLVAAPCSARGPYGVLRWVLRMRNSGSQRSAILTARTLACTLSDTVQAIPQLARLLLQCHIPKNPQTCCKSARTCIYRCVVCSM